MDNAALTRLAGLLEAQYKYYHGWHFQHERDTLSYAQMGDSLQVYCTPDVEADGTVAIQVIDNDTGEVLEAEEVPFRSTVANPWEFFRIVKPFLDKYQG